MEFADIVQRDQLDNESVRNLGLDFQQLGKKHPPAGKLVQQGVGSRCHIERVIDKSSVSAFGLAA